MSTELPTLTLQGEFNYHVFDDDILIVGTKGEGKTTIAQNIVNSLPHGVTVIVWDFSDRFGNMGHLITEDWKQILGLLGTIIIIQATDKTKANWLRFCKFIFDNVKNVLVVNDEIHQYLTKQSIEDEHYELVMSGRNKGICSISISTGTTAIPNYVVKNCNHVFAMIHHLPSDVEWLAKWVGPECWQLLPQDKRRQQNKAKAYWDIENLPKHSYIYRDMHQPNCHVVRSS